LWVRFSLAPNAELARFVSLTVVIFDHGPARSKTHVGVSVRSRRVFPMQRNQPDARLQAQHLLDAANEVHWRRVITDYAALACRLIRAESTEWRLS
jgi:hypothetical protein